MSESEQEQAASAPDAPSVTPAPTAAPDSAPPAPALLSEPEQELAPASDARAPPPSSARAPSPTTSFSPDASPTTSFARTRTGSLTGGRKSSLAAIADGALAPGLHAAGGAATLDQRVQNHLEEKEEALEATRRVSQAGRKASTRRASASFVQVLETRVRDRASTHADATARQAQFLAEGRLATEVSADSKARSRQRRLSSALDDALADAALIEAFKQRGAQDDLFRPENNAVGHTTPGQRDIVARVLDEAERARVEALLESLSPPPSPKAYAPTVPRSPRPGLTRLPRTHELYIPGLDDEEDESGGYAEGAGVDPMLFTPTGDSRDHGGGSPLGSPHVRSARSTARLSARSAHSTARSSSPPTGASSRTTSRTSLYYDASPRTVVHPAKRAPPPSVRAAGYDTCKEHLLSLVPFRLREKPIQPHTSPPRTGSSPALRPPSPSLAKCQSMEYPVRLPLDQSPQAYRPSKARAAATRPSGRYNP